MSTYQIVLDTNIIVAALRSNKGASFKVLGLVGANDKFEINLSVPLVLEYEAVTKRFIESGNLLEEDITDVLDYLCHVGHLRQIYFLWRPHLKDPKDDMVLEVAVAAGCDYIVTFNKKDFGDIARFGIEAVTPQEFLRVIGELT